MALQRYPEALVEADRAVALNPSDPRGLAMRANIQRHMGHFDLALADSAAALKLNPANDDLYQTRANIYVAMGQPDKALAEAQAGVAANPKSDMPHIFLAAVYAHQGRQKDAMTEFGKAIAIKPTPPAYLTRANARPDSDVAGKRADIAAATKLDPSLPEEQEMTLALELRLGNYAAVIPAATALLAKRPTSVQLLVDRGVAYARSGRQADADKDFAAARAAAGADVNALNTACWDKATHNVVLASALADCDAALKLQPDRANIIDSRGFVLLRLGRY
jgi:tetratricopeptide (TPR) repeat protein